MRGDLSSSELVEKLRFHLQEKDKELEKKKQEIKELSANLDLAMTRANKIDELGTELAKAQETILTLQMSLWKSFPSWNLCYYLKVRMPVVSQDGIQYEYHYLFTDNLQYNLEYLLSWDDRPRHGSKFIFTKHPLDGTYSIYSVAKQRYLQRLVPSQKFRFSANDCCINAKFLLFFHEQNQLPGLLVDICTVAGYFLFLDDNNNVVANSLTPPANKFLIIPAGVQ